MDETKKILGEDTDVGLTTATLAGAGARTDVGAVGAPSFRAGSSSSAGAATAVALDKHVVPLYSAEEAKEFRARWDAIQVNFVDEPRHGQLDA